MYRKIIEEQAREYLEEFEKSTLGECDEEHVVYIGDKHYFDFNTTTNTVEVSDIIYW